MTFKIKDMTDRYLSAGITLMLAVFLFVIPFPFNTSIQEICFYLSVAGAFILAFCGRRNLYILTPFALPFMMLLIWSLVGLINAFDRTNSIHDIYAHLVKYLILFLLVINFFLDRKRFVLLAWILAASASLLAFVGLIYFYVYSGNSLSVRFGLPVLDIGVNAIGFFTVPALIFCVQIISKERRILQRVVAVFCLLVSGTAVVLTATLGTLLGLIIPLLLWVLKDKKNLLYLIALLLIVVLSPAHLLLTPKTIVHDKILENERPLIWSTYKDIIKDHPITGIGFGMLVYNKSLLEKYPAKYKLTPKNQFYHPHSVYVDITVRLGIVGLAFFLYLIFTCGRIAYRLIRHGHDDFIKTWAMCVGAVLLSLFIQGAFTDMLIGLHDVLFFVFLSMLALLWRFNEEMETSVPARN